MSRHGKTVKKLVYNYKHTKIVVEHQKNAIKHTLNIYAPELSLKHVHKDMTCAKKRAWDIEEEIRSSINYFENKVDSQKTLENKIDNTFNKIAEEKNAKTKKPFWSKIL